MTLVRGLVLDRSAIHLLLKSTIKKADQNKSSDQEKVI